MRGYKLYALVHKQIIHRTCNLLFSLLPSLHKLIKTNSKLTNLEYIHHTLSKKQNSAVNCNINKMRATDRRRYINCNIINCSGKKRMTLNTVRKTLSSCLKALEILSLNLTVMYLFNENFYKNFNIFP